ncbi:hypothetical protein PAPYR_1359 [Paratrimastix pyriformis]|uniref:Uncharacterized protein n=1 Tax=Paratrimastix pyriformis TaxID=342808 RepID=A0ABQ8USR0_9EUKA|nr:hypothetical protein PAPYR_1359 [Paratrimastix pyriformis]
METTNADFLREVEETITRVHFMLAQDALAAGNYEQSLLWLDYAARGLHLLEPPAAATPGSEDTQRDANPATRIHPALLAATWTIYATCCTGLGQRMHVRLQQYLAAYQEYQARLAAHAPAKPPPQPQLLELDQLVRSPIEGVVSASSSLAASSGLLKFPTLGHLHYPGFPEPQPDPIPILRTAAGAAQAALPDPQGKEIVLRRALVKDDAPDDDDDDADGTPTRRPGAGDGRAMWERGPRVLVAEPEDLLQMALEIVPWLTLTGSGLAYALLRGGMRAQGYLRALFLISPVGDTSAVEFIKRRLGNARNELGKVLLEKQRYTKAKECFQRAVEEFREIGDRPNHAIALCNQAQICIQAHNLHDRLQPHAPSFAPAPPAPAPEAAKDKAKSARGKGGEPEEWEHFFRDAIGYYEQALVVLSSGPPLRAGPDLLNLTHPAAPCSPPLGPTTPRGIPLMLLRDPPPPLPPTLLSSVPMPAGRTPDALQQQQQQQAGKEQPTVPLVPPLNLAAERPKDFTGLAASPQYRSVSTLLANTKMVFAIRLQNHMAEAASPHAQEDMETRIHDLLTSAIDLHEQMRNRSMAATARFYLATLLGQQALAALTQEKDYTKRVKSLLQLSLSYFERAQGEYSHQEEPFDWVNCHVRTSLLLLRFATELAHWSAGSGCVISSLAPGYSGSSRKLLAQCRAWLDAALGHLFATHPVLVAQQGNAHFMEKVNSLVLDNLRLVLKEALHNLLTNLPAAPQAPAASMPAKPKIQPSSKLQTGTVAPAISSAKEIYRDALQSNEPLVVLLPRLAERWRTEAPLKM